MQEFKITAEAITNIIKLLVDLPYKQTAHLLSYDGKGGIALNGVSQLDPVPKEIDNGDTKQQRPS